MKFRAAVLNGVKQPLTLDTLDMLDMALSRSRPR